MNMQKSKSRIAVLLLISLLLSVLFSLFSVVTFADEASGIATGKKLRYISDAPIKTLPKTYEVTVRIGEDYESTGPIFSNYTNATTPSFQLYVNSEGAPAFYMYEGVGKRYPIIFDEINLKTGNWEHIVVTIDPEASLARCYINGELKSEKSADMPSSLDMTNHLVVGGNYILTNYFSGEILNLAFFSDERSASEIAQDANSVTSESELVCHYDFSSFDRTNPPEKIDDLSSCKNNLSFFSQLYDEPQVPLNDYAYSFAIVGDIQVVNCYNPENLHYIYDWIIENKEEKKIEFAFNLGDITDKNTEAEWIRANEVIHSLDGVVPYSIIRGNHDKSVSYYKKYFKYEDYKDVIAGSYYGDMLNTYQTFEVCGNKYLVLNIDFKYDRYVINWANKIVEQYHDHNVIVTTHIYMAADGTTLDTENDRLSADKYGAAYDGDGLWDVFLSQHKNITMVLSGHISSASIVTTQRKGVHGNTVTQMLIDPQGVDGQNDGGLGLVAMLYFSEDGKHVQTQYYSTIKNQYFLPPNEYDITLDPIQSNNSVPNNHSYSEEFKSDSSAHWHGCACGLTRDYEEHTFGDWKILREATEEIKGLKEKGCSCGYTVAEYYEYEPPIIPEDNGTALTVIIVCCASGVVLIGTGSFVAYYIIKKKKKA